MGHKQNKTQKTQKTKPKTQSKTNTKIYNKKN